MPDDFVSVHELKAKLSEYLSRAVHGKTRIIVKRREKPVAMLVPIADNSAATRKGLASVSWEEFSGVAEFVDAAYEARQDGSYREIPF